jgi:hypothetical protein
VCLEQEKQWRPNGELAAETLEILFDLGVLVPGLLRETITSAEGSDRLGAWLRKEVLTTPDT